MLRIVPAPPDVLARIPDLKTEFTSRFVLHRRTIEDRGKSIRGFRRCIRTKLANPFEKAKSDFLAEDLDACGFSAIRGNRHRKSLGPKNRQESIENPSARSKLCFVTRTSRHISPARGHKTLRPSVDPRVNARRVRLTSASGSGTKGSKPGDVEFFKALDERKFRAFRVRHRHCGRGAIPQVELPADRPPHSRQVGHRRQRRALGTLIYRLGPISSSRQRHLESPTDFRKGHIRYAVRGCELRNWLLPHLLIKLCAIPEFRGVIPPSSYQPSRGNEMSREPMWPALQPYAS